TASLPSNAARRSVTGSVIHPPMYTPMEARMSRYTKSAFGAAVGALAALALAACSGASSAPADNAAAASDRVDEDIRALLPEDIRERGTLSVVTDPSQAPYEFVDDDDNIVGINPDLA